MAGLRSIVSVVEGGELLEDNLHVGGREIVDIAVDLDLLHCLLGKGYKKGKRYTKKAKVIQERRKLSLWREK